MQQFLLTSLLFLLVAKSVSSERPAGSKLKFVHLLYRHGDRSPGSTFPTDPCGLQVESCWPQGWSQLTLLGMQQHYELGGFFRRRYVETEGFLSANYTRSEIYVRSTDKDRTLQSASSNLAGFYPPDSSQLFNSSVQWQPIPIHTIPAKDDYMLEMDESGCTEYSRLWHSQTDAKVAEINSANAEFFKYLEVQTGLRNLTFLDIGDVYGPLFRGSANGRGLPDWATANWPADNISVYQKVLNLEDQMKQVDYNTPEKAKFKGGPLLGDIITRMQEKVKSTFIIREKKKTDSSIKDLKVYMYSAHDDTVLALLGALQQLNGRITPYAAAVMVELWYNPSEPQVNYVDVFYRNDTKMDPYQLAIPGCNQPCSLTDFIAATKSTTIYGKSELNTACKSTTDSSTMSTSGINTSTSGAATIHFSWIGLLLATLILWLL